MPFICNKDDIKLVGSARPQNGITAFKWFINYNPRFSHLAKKKTSRVFRRKIREILKQGQEE